jgi:UDP-galactopyranose mutase
MRSSANGHRSTGAFDIVCLAHLPWDLVFQRPHHLMTRAARSGQVLYVEEPRDDASEPFAEIRCTEGGVQVLVPHLPRGAELEDADSMCAELVRSALDERGMHHVVAWLTTPMWAPVASRLSPAAIVYDCMDELTGFAQAPPQLPEREARLMQEADLVFTGGRSLYEARCEQREQVHLFPSSVDAAHFGTARGAQEDPDDQRGLPRPRLGFAGVIDERLDTGLLAAVADARPDWQLVMVGPVVKIDPGTLPQRPNIAYLGPKPYPDLPRYMAGWDVGMLPFAHNDATRFISPTKTPEYLAAGLPVVSTSIADVVAAYADLAIVEIADGAEDVIAACERLLALDLAEARIEGDARLAASSWDSTYERMSALIRGAIERRGGGASADPPAPQLRVVARGFDFMIAGAGFAGSVLAERLADAGHRVMVVEKRRHIGGNAYDEHDEAGILIHRYGPHIFHTNSADVFDYLSRFTAWRPYEHRVLASVDGQLVPLPINLDTVNQLYGLSLTSFELEEFFAGVAEPVEHPVTSEDVVVSRVGRELYEKFFRGYTRKQWGLDPSELDACVTARVPTRTNRDDRYFTDTYQAMPLHGYTRLFERMLDHPGITIVLGTDYRELADIVPHRELVYTGPIDEYFGSCHGTLPYRSLDFRFETYDEPRRQPAAVVNYPNEHAYTRATEFKYLTGQEHPKTTLVYEHPTAEGDPYYPIPRPENAELYKRYKALADATPGVHFVGRLACYRYYNMDQVVAQALVTAKRILQRGSDGFRTAGANGTGTGNGRGLHNGRSAGVVRRLPTRPERDADGRGPRAPTPA